MRMFAPYFRLNHLDIAPQHASVLLGISNTFGTIPGIVSPALTGYIVVNSSADEWQIVFLISSAIYLIGCVIFWFWTSGEIQPWAQKTLTKDQNKQKPTEDRTYVGYTNEGLEIKE